MTDKRLNMYQLEQNLLHDLNENKNQILNNEVSLTEYVESAVPVYNYDLLLLACDDLWLGYPNGYICEGEHKYDAYEIIKWNVYEKLLNFANDWLTKLKEEEAAAPKPGLRIVEHIRWEGKDYPLPFYGMDLDTDRNKIITIKNRFGGDSISIPWFAAAVYDVIMGSEKLNQWDDHAKGLEWFGEYFPDAYMVLLD